MVPAADSAAVDPTAAASAVVDRGTADAGTIDISVVLPVYNEVGHLAQEVKRIRAALEASGRTFEIIVVDDGSDDGSGEALDAIEGIRLLRFATNRGSGSARRAGTRAAAGRLVAWTDCDLTYPNEEIPHLADLLDEGYDQVVGARTSEQGTLRALRVPAKWTIRKLASYLTDTPIPDLNSGLRVFRRDVALQFLHLLPRGFSCVTTLTMTFLANDYAVRYEPIDYFPRAGRSKFHWWSDTRRYILQVVRMVLMFNPLRVFGPVGLFLLAFGFGKTVYDLMEKHGRIATNTIVVLLAAGMVIMIGLLSDLVVQLNRPTDGVEPATRA
ncbi:MAG: glycosyltransferase family 2 protein [Acidimicrobiales bacterium]